MPVGGSAGDDGASAPTDRAIRVLVVERRRVFATALATALAAAPDLDVVGCLGALGDGGLGRLRPEVAVIAVDLASAVGGQVDALRAEAPEARALILSEAPDDEMLAACARAGTAGVVSMDSSAEDLARAITRVRTGETLFAPQTLFRLLHQPRGGAAPAEPAPQGAALAPREREVLEASAAGLNAAEVAARLGVSTHTARTHLKNAMKKLGAHSKLEAVLTALRLGLIEPGD
jgi:DNA-binding NarL/FixJ family response regulator